MARLSLVSVIQPYRRGLRREGVLEVRGTRGQCRGAARPNEHLQLTSRKPKWGRKKGTRTGRGQFLESEESPRAAFGENRHVPKHQNAVQLRAAGDRRGDPRGFS